MAEQLKRRNTQVPLYSLEEQKKVRECIKNLCKQCAILRKEYKKVIRLRVNCRKEFEKKYDLLNKRFARAIDKEQRSLTNEYEKKLALLDKDSLSKKIYDTINDIAKAQEELETEQKRYRLLCKKEKIDKEQILLTRSISNADPA